MGQSFEEAVGESLLFDIERGGLAMLANEFVKFLAISAGFDAGHENGFGGHEGEFFAQILGDGGGVDDHSLDNILEEDKAGIDAEEGLRKDKTSVGAIVERAFEPLDRGGHHGAGLEAHHKPADAADAFAAHGVSFVGHGGGADLFGFEGFFEFFAMREEADIGGDFMEAGGDSAEAIEDLGIDFSGVGLAGNGVAGGEAHALGDAGFEFSDFGVITLKELEEAGLGTGRPFDAAAFEGLEAVGDFFEIGDEIVGPESRAFADGGGLGGLEVREGEAGEGGMLFGEGGEASEAGGESLLGELEGVADEPEVGVVGDVAAGGAPVDDGSGGGALIAVGMDMGHDIVAFFAFVFGGDLHIGLVAKGSHFLDLLVGDTESEFLLFFGENDPEFAPEADASLSAPDAGHGPGGVAGDEWVFVDIVRVDVGGEGGGERVHRGGASKRGKEHSETANVRGLDRIDYPGMLATHPQVAK